MRLPGDPLFRRSHFPIDFECYILIAYGVAGVIWGIGHCFHWTTAGARGPTGEFREKDRGE